MEIKINKKKIIVIVLVMSHGVAYVLGSIINREKILSEISKEFERANAEVNLGRYMEYRDIIVSVNDKEYGKAKCYAQLGASAMYDDLKSCVAEADCGNSIMRKINDNAPEILDDGTLNFTYLERNKNGIRLCKKTGR